jgi:glycosyltransferase involved in cell wall biosynthesis
MKVLMLSHTKGDVANGSRIGFLRFADSLAQSHEVRLLTTCTYVTGRGLGDLRTYETRITLPTGHLRGIKMFRTLLGAIREESPEILVCCQGALAPVYLAAAKLTRIALVMIIWDIPNWKNMIRPSVLKAKWPLRWALFTQTYYFQAYAFLRFFDLVLFSTCLSFPAAERLRIHRKQVLGAILPDAHPSKSQRDEGLILVVNRLAYNKSLPTVKEIAAKIGPGLRLVWLGDGKLRQRFEAECKRLPIEFKGGVSDETRDEYLDRAKCLLYATQFEGFGLPPGEAIARGCPVVASDLPVLREVYGDSLNYFKSVDEAVALISKPLPAPDQSVLRRWSAKEMGLRLEGALYSCLRDSRHGVMD